MINTYIAALVQYGIQTGLCQENDRVYITNRLLETLHLDSFEPSEAQLPTNLEEILRGLLDYAVANNLCEDNITAKDLFDTKLMSVLTPFPHEV